MKSLRHVKSIMGAACILALAGCDTLNTASPSPVLQPQTATPSAAYVGYGVVQSIELVKQANTGIGGSGVGVGAIAGAVVGGILGNQVGGGSGKTAATVIGAAGGAYAGHEIEKRNQQQTDAYKLTLRMNDGSFQTLTQSTTADVRVGDRVKVENGVAKRY